MRTEHDKRDDLQRYAERKRTASIIMSIIACVLAWTAVIINIVSR